MAGLFAPAHKSDDSADARRIAENARKGANLNTALTAFHAPSNSRAKHDAETRSGNGIKAIMGGPMLERLAEEQRGQQARTASKAESILIDRRVQALNLPTPQAALLSLAVKADEREGGAALISISRSEAASAIGVSVEKADAVLGALTARGYLRFCDNGSGDRGYRVTLPKEPLY
jgi:hypothetical protein